MTTVFGSTTTNSTAQDAAAFSAAYQRDGYLIVTGLFSHAECDMYKTEAKRIIVEHGKAFSTVYVGAAIISNLFRQMADDARVVEILSALMPGGIAFMSDKVVFKSNAQQAATPWHADAQYWPGTRSKLSIWIPLDDATRDNGTLMVVRGSHLRDWQTEEGSGINQAGDFNRVVSAQQWAQADEVICEIPRGSAIFFSDKLLHASTPNSTGADRFTIISTYQAPVEMEEPFDLHFPARHTIRVA